MAWTRFLRTSPANIGPKPVPPEPDGLVAVVDAAFEQQVLDVPQRERVPNVHHDHQSDDLGRGIEPAKRVLRRLGLGHQRQLPTLR
jgi:hypothetical protein